MDTGKDSVGQIALDLVVNKNDFEKQMTGIRGLAKKAGAALAGAFAIKKLVDFSKSCIELGSDLAEVQNVVDVTFPHMNQQINQFAQNAAKQFGLSRRWRSALRVPLAQWRKRLASEKRLLMICPQR